MASVSYYFLLVLVFLDSRAAQPSCLPGCTCSEESFGRTQQCISISLGKIPGNLPEEFKLTVVSKSVSLYWLAYQKHQQPGCGAKILSSMVLALHNNPQLCDCCLRGLVEFVKSISLPVILVNPYLMCQGPLSKVGQFFHETELSICMKSQVSTPSANVTIQVGQNVTLQCLALVSPSPTIAWTYPMSIWREFDVLTSSTTEDAALSELLIPAAHLVDRGHYTCVASNSIGRSTTVISLHIQPALQPLSSPLGDNADVDLQVVKQTMRGILLEWFAVANTTEEKWFTLYIASDVAVRKEVVHIGPRMDTYVVDDLLLGTEYEACLSLGGQPPRQGHCVVFETGRDHGRLDVKERLLHITVVLCAVLLSVSVGTYIWAAQAPCRCRQWCRCFCPCHRKAPGAPCSPTAQGGLLQGPCSCL
ncbi:leucine-rich repeat, immunoglobulin-like domain and transmembrane domain-containing protein 2 [Hipposideros larvatus]